VTSREYWGDVNASFAKLFGEHKPARAIVPVSALKAGCFVEIQVVAATAAEATL
jgi:enamine deaminase RidA (YjgF/YER057c/UK114 family)